MMLLALRNPQATGVTSDDGFRMGQFTISGTLALLVTTTLLGVLGGGIYLVLRHLMIGPRWFQVVAIFCGPAIVVGSILVHTELTVSTPRFCSRSNLPSRCSWRFLSCTGCC